MVDADMVMAAARVHIIGGPGGGKTTLSMHLARQRGGVPLKLGSGVFPRGWRVNGVSGRNVSVRNVVAILIPIAMVLLPGCGGADPVAPERTPTSVATEGRGEAAVVDQADVDYVDALCLIGTRWTDEGREAAGRWGVAFETWWEDIRGIPDDQHGEFAEEALVEPLRNQRAALEGMSAPPGVEEFHAAAVSHRVEQIQALDALLQLFPSEGRSEGPSAPYAYARLLAGIEEINITAPAASVELRRRLFGAARETPGCADIYFLSVFLGGGEPTVRPSKVDEEYLGELCSVGKVFEAALVDMLSQPNSRLDDEVGARVVSAFIDSMEELLAGLSATSPPDDIAAFQVEYMALVEEGIAVYGKLLEVIENDGDPPRDSHWEEQFVHVQRLFSGEGDPIPPAAVRTRLLESANSVEGCSGGTGFLHAFLGSEGE